MSNKHGDPLWYELLTDDVAAATEFYGPVLGWKVRDSAAGGGGVPGYYLFGTGETDIGGMMKIDAEGKAAGMRPVWLGYVAVDDVDAAVAKIEASGGARHMGPMDIPNVGRFALVADPQGAAFYVMRGFVEGEVSRSFQPDGIGHCNWNELNTSDQAAAWRFYGEQFGWRKGDSMSMGEMGDYEFLDHGGQTIGAFARCTMPERPQWRYYFGVDDIDRAGSAVTGGGGTIAFGPSEIPGGSYIIIAIDPQGAQFGLVGPRKS